jgi:hypothetical protein
VVFTVPENRTSKARGWVFGTHNVGGGDAYAMEVKCRVILPNSSEIILATPRVACKRYKRASLAASRLPPTHPPGSGPTPEAMWTSIVAWYGAPGARGRRPSAARKGGPSAHGAPLARRLDPVENNSAVEATSKVSSPT